jgi:hypothetical protein
MKHVNIIQASRLVLKGDLDTTPYEEKKGVLIGKNLYYESGIGPDGKAFAWSGDIYLVDDEYEPDINASVG